MNLAENITPEYYKAFVEDKTRMHSSLVFIKGSELNTSNGSLMKIARTTCALANSGGGNIIYGIAPKRNRAEELDGVKNFDKTESWLWNEIQAQIDRPIKDLSVKNYRISILI